MKSTENTTVLRSLAVKHLKKGILVIKVKRIWDLIIITKTAEPSLIDLNQAYMILIPIFWLKPWQLSPIDHAYVSVL